MAVYFAVGTPAEDGRIQDFRMIPPPGGSGEGQILVWNAAKQEPEWRLLSDLVTIPAPVSGYFPVADVEGRWLVDSTGARLVGLPST